MLVGSPLHLTEVREAESRMALTFLKTVALTGRATQALAEDRSSAHVGILDCHILPGGDLILSRLSDVAGARTSTLASGHT